MRSYFGWCAFGFSSSAYTALPLLSFTSITLLLRFEPNSFPSLLSQIRSPHSELSAQFSYSSPNTQNSQQSTQSHTAVTHCLCFVVPKSDFKCFCIVFMSLPILINNVESAGVTGGDKVQHVLQVSLWLQYCTYSIFCIIISTYGFVYS